MKPRFASLLASLAVVMYAKAEPTEPVTNAVPIGQEGIRLALTDDLDTPGATFQSMLADQELVADQPIYWLLHNTSSNWSSFIFLGLSNSFAFELLTTNGIVLPKTAKGKGMSRGPKSLTDFFANRPRRQSVLPGGGSIRDFPRMVELFRFPSNGVYILELRYWVWALPKKTFVLSEPVRIRVLYHGTNAPLPTVLKVFREGGRP